MRKSADHVYQDDAGGYLITNPAEIRQQNELSGRFLSTREIKLDNLGVFPLAQASLPLLDKTLQLGETKLGITPLLRKSQIPIFSSPDATSIYIPPEGCVICRYFHELWRVESEGQEVADPVLAGFAIIASYAGF